MEEEELSGKGISSQRGQGLHEDGAGLDSGEKSTQDAAVSAVGDERGKASCSQMVETLEAGGDLIGM